MRRPSAIALIWLLVAQPPTVCAESLSSPEVARLFDLIEHRAALMSDVAAWKWHVGRPVLDAQREAAVLAGATAEAEAAGLEQGGARAFVSAQMAVSRSIQMRAFEGFESAPPPADGPNLLTDLRPAISATTAEMLRILPRVLPMLQRPSPRRRSELHRRLEPLGASRPAINELADALLHLRPARTGEDRIAAIRTRGTIRVATTGDYAPFSYVSDDGTRTGVDITLARALAEALGVAIEWIETSWPTLLEDLRADRFDIAMSGISRTTARALEGVLSDPYHVGGKTPVIRCADRARFPDFAAIDAQDVRAVVNPGGTNEAFARDRLEHASLRIHGDNRTIFEEITEARADVMFTDAIEVARVIRDDPRLCPALPGVTLTYQEKGFLLPRDESDAWPRFIDLWLDQVQGDGTIAAAFAAH